MTALFYLQGKCTFKAPYTRERVIKFNVYSVFDCFTSSFLRLFIVAGMKRIWHMSFACVRIKVIGYVSFVFTCIICIWLCLWVPVCFAILTAVCLVCMSNFLSAVLLSIVSDITLMPSNSLSDILNNTGPLPGTTKNPHLTHLLLCPTFSEHLLNCSMFDWLYVLITIDLFLWHLTPPWLT